LASVAVLPGAAIVQSDRRDQRSGLRQIGAQIGDLPAQIGTVSAQIGSGLAVRRRTRLICAAMPSI
jgi:hypothetical protein